MKLLRDVWRMVRGPTNPAQAAELAHRRLGMSVEAAWRAVHRAQAEVDDREDGRAIWDEVLRRHV